MGIDPVYTRLKNEGITRWRKVDMGPNYTRVKMMDTRPVCIRIVKVGRGSVGTRL